MGQMNSETQEKGLATFEDQENKLHSTVLEAVPQPFQSNPYPDQTPRAICERWVQITTAAINDSSVITNSFIAGSSIFFNTFIEEALQTFRYARFKAIEWRVQYHSTPFYYGWIGLTCLPQRIGSFTGLSYANTSGVVKYFCSHTDTVLLDFSQQQDVVLSTPWLSPCQWIDLTDLYTDNIVDTAVQALDNLHSLRIFCPPHAVKFVNSTAHSTLTLQVFARIVGLETAGPINNNSSAPMSNNRIESQSKDGFWSMLGGASFKAHDDFVLNAGKGYGGGTSDSRQPLLGNASSGQNDSDEPELKPNVFGSLVSTSAKYPLGTGTLIGPTRAHSLLDYMKIPTLLSFGVLDNTANVPVALTGGIGATLDYSRICYLSQYFRFWRGSIKYTLVIFGSPFIAARYNVILSYERSGGAPLGKIANELIKDVTVRGTTQVDVDVPFLSLSNWLPTYIVSSSLTPPSVFADCVPKLWIMPLQTPISSGDVSPTLPFVLYQAAGDDFQLRGLINGNPSQLAVDTIESQMYVSSFCKSKDEMSTGSVPKLPYSADVEITFQDVMSRWTYADSNLFTPIPALDIQGYNDTGSPPLEWYSPVTVFDAFGCLFGFCSGQVKFKIPWDENSTGASVIGVLLDDNLVVGPTTGTGVLVASVPDMYKAENGLNIVDITISKVTEFTLPWMNAYEFLPTGVSNATFKGYFMFSPAPFWGDFQPLIFSDTGTVSTFKCFRAAGSDYSLFYPLPPPIETLPMWVANFAPSGAVLSTTSGKDSNVHNPSLSLVPRDEKQKTIRRFLPAGADDQRSDVRKELSSEDEVARAYAVLHKHNLLVPKENRNPLSKTCSLSDAV